jgi:transcriptional regulator with XRE-family HTH domain
MTGHEISDAVGRNIRALRKANRLSVSDLAARLARLGGKGERLTAPIIENIEHGRRRNGERTRDVTVDELVVLAQALRTSIDMLLPDLGNGGIPEDPVPFTLENKEVIMNRIRANMKFTEQLFETLEELD